MPRPIYRLYIDESGDAQTKDVVDRRNRFLGLTGLAIRTADHDGPMTDALETLRTAHFPAHRSPNPVILHRAELVRDEGPFGVLRDPARAAAWEEAILDFIDRWAVDPITFVIDKLATQVKYGDDDEDPYLRAMRYMLERYRGMLHYRGAVGDVVFEARGKREDRRLRSAYRDVFNRGTEYLAAAEMQGVLTTKHLKIAQKQADIAGLQLADLLASPMRASVLQDRLGDAPIPGATQRIIELVRPNYHTANRRLFPDPQKRP